MLLDICNFSHELPIHILYLFFSTFFLFISRSSLYIKEISFLSSVFHFLFFRFYSLSFGCSNIHLKDLHCYSHLHYFYLSLYLGQILKGFSHSNIIKNVPHFFSSFILWFISYHGFIFCI